MTTQYMSLFCGVRGIPCSFKIVRNLLTEKNRKLIRKDELLLYNRIDDASLHEITVRLHLNTSCLSFLSLYCHVQIHSYPPSFHITFHRFSNDLLSLGFLTATLLPRHAPLLLSQEVSIPATPACSSTAPPNGGCGGQGRPLVAAMEAVQTCFKGCNLRSFAA